MMQTSERDDALSSPNNDVSAEPDFEAHAGMRDMLLHGSDESFDVGVEEAAFILGVGRTRLSQLTSKGVFCFERRKIGTRNRLFYRRADLETYLAETYGRSARNPLAGLDPRRLAEELSPHLRDFAESADDDFSVCEEPEEAQPAGVQASQLRLTSRREPPARSLLQTARDVSQHVQHQAVARESLDTLLRLGHLVEGLERRIQSLQLALTRLDARVTQAEPKLQSAASVLTSSPAASPASVPRVRSPRYRLPRR